MTRTGNQRPCQTMRDVDIMTDDVDEYELLCQEEWERECEREFFENYDEYMDTLSCEYFDTPAEQTKDGAT